MRRIELPNSVDSDKAEATIDRGLLTLKLPKVASEASKTIKVQKNGAQSAQSSASKA